MFKKNESYKQYELFSVGPQLTKKQRKMWENSLEHRFFTHIFQQIEESQFSVLFSAKGSRPNVPVNQMVGALILKHLFDWTYEELFKHLSFNMLTRHAIGLQSLDSDIFAEASLYNFQNRLIEHYTESGTDLLMEVFDQLTQDQLSSLGIKTDIQRGDSFLIGSNIIDYGRLQLLIEVLKRFYRILSKEDRETYSAAFSAYSDKTAGQYIYRVEKNDLPQEFSLLAQSYHQLHQDLADQYGDHQVFQIFARVYQEHFTFVDEKLAVVESKELHSAILMSPDDTEATYRDKGKKQSKGYVGHLSETAHPDNSTQLITDIDLQTNNTDDAAILSERLESMKEKTPELNAYFNDGLYTSPKVDLLMDQLGITQYQTGIRGRRSLTEIKIHEKENGQYWVSCKGGQEVQAQKKKKWRLRFDPDICATCPWADICKMPQREGKKVKRYRFWTFTQSHILRHLRMANFEKLPDHMKTLRANVEATVKQAQFGMKNGKIRVRTMNKARAYLTLTCIGINLKRVHKALGKAKMPIKTQNIEDKLANMILIGSRGTRILRHYQIIQRTIREIKRKIFFKPSLNVTF